MRNKKKKKTELDVDYIGGNVQLTESEEKALSEFFKLQKSKIIKKKSLENKKLKRSPEKQR
ncbi:MAG: hypothetical protein L6Q47_04880 [Ignavibacteriaceae bacterium]|nr:hypothetical protein [Ignavibacteriaceae bacterium]